MDYAPNYPVIVVHLADPNYPTLTACGPARLPDTTGTYEGIPRYQCQACFRLMLLETAELEEITVIMEHELLWTTDPTFAGYYGGSERPDARAYCRCGWVAKHDASEQASRQRLQFIQHLEAQDG